MYIYIDIIKITFGIYKKNIKVMLQSYPRFIIFTKMIIFVLLILSINIIQYS